MRKFTQSTQSVSVTDCKSVLIFLITKYAKPLSRMALFMSLFIFISVSTLQAQNIGDKFKVDDLYYKITSISPNKVEVSPQNDNYPYWDNDQKPTGDITIPEAVEYNNENYSVTNIGNNAFGYSTSLTSVDIPNSVTNIGQSTFYNCTSLTSVYIPNSVTNIEERAFGHCTDLTSVYIPNSVIHIGKRAFYNCASLASIDISNSITNIEERAFGYCINLTSVDIPNSITNIGNYAFVGCIKVSRINSEIENIANLTMGSSVFVGIDTVQCILNVPNGKVDDYKAAGQWKNFINITDQDISLSDIKFEHNGLYYVKIADDKLAVVHKNINYNEPWGDNEPTGEVTIPQTINHNGKDYSVTTIRKWAFYNCKNLSTVNIPASVTSIETWVFNGCKSLTSININSGNTVYKSENGILFNKSKTTLVIYPQAKPETSYIIPNSVTNIEKYSFSSCISLTSVDIPNSVTNIGDAAFENCISLISVDIPNSVTSIGQSAFYDCISLISVDIPNSITSVENFAFYNCKSLISVDIPNSVTSMGDFSFSSCKSLANTTSLINNVSNVTMGIRTFDWSNNSVLHVPAGTKGDYQAADIWKYFDNIQEIIAGSVTHVILSKSSKIVAVGDEFTLEASVKPNDATNKNVTWSTSDANIATVDAGGKVTALQLGEATITATSEDGNKTATCTVTVGVPVEGVTLDKISHKVNVGEEFTLQATVNPGNATVKDLKWRTSNWFVASVDDNGKVTTHREGIATITATSEDGNYTANCMVTVAAIPVTSVTLDKATHTLILGEEFTLQATVNPDNATNKKLIWKSDNREVAKVINGIVKSQKPGTANITVTTIDGNYTATCTVMVKIPVTGVTLDKTTHTINVGEEFTLQANISPDNATNKNVTWSTSDAAIATVDDNGKITAKKAGTATITVTTEDGNYTATCTVTVTAIPVTSVTLDKTTHTINVGEEFTLQATVNPDNATNKNITWSTSDATVATVDDNGKVTAKKAGTATITVTTEDGNHTATCEITVTKKSTAIEYVDNTLKVNVYPTVVGDGFTVAFADKFKKVLTLEIYSLSGTKVYTKRINKDKQYVNVSSLKQGVYMVKLGNKTYKIVKK